MATAALSNSWDTLGDWADIALNYGVAFGETLGNVVETIYGDVVRDPIQQITGTLDDLGQGTSKALSILPWAIAIIGIIFLIFYLKGGAK